MTTSDPTQSNARVAELEAKVAELEAKLEALQHSEMIYRHIVEKAPASISRLSPDARLIHANEYALGLLGFSLEELIGKDIIPLLYPGELRPPVDEYFRIAAEGGDVKDYELVIQTRAGERRILEWNSYHRFAEDGSLIEVISFGVDVTERRQQEAEHRALQEQVIAQQASALVELSTPLVPISDNIVAMPLIGVIDEERSSRIIESLLTGITESRAHTAILDITGVSVVDAQVANAIISAARAVRLLGARVILTGIQPSVAQMFVDIGPNFEHVTTCGTLQDGVAFALARDGKALGGRSTR